MSTDHLNIKIPVYQVPSRLLDTSKCPKPHVDSLNKYKQLYEESINDPQAFWGRVSLRHGLLRNCVLLCIFYDSLNVSINILKIQNSINSKPENSLIGINLSKQFLPVGLNMGM